MPPTSLAMEVYGMKQLSFLLFLSIGLVLLSCAGAQAQPLQMQPGSSLVFPLVDNRPGHGTMVSVTNLLDDDRACPDRDARRGDVLLQYLYVDAETQDEFERYEFLVPGDTLSVLTERTASELEVGYLVVSAFDPVDPTRAIQYDHLMGSAIIAQAGPNFMFSYTPYAFLGRPNRDAPDPCERRRTDVDGDGRPDFDGSEYSLFPREIVVESFIEEKGVFGNTLTLLTTSAPEHVAELHVRFRNNVGTRYDEWFEFSHWWTGSLGEVSEVASSLLGNRHELGFREVETGWVSFRGVRIVDSSGNPVRNRRGHAAVPPILGVFTQYAHNTAFSGGHALQYHGTLDGLELRGNRDRQRP